jgi:YbbR domain-containing protein
MLRNWQYRLLALVLAFACWYLVTGQQKVETWLEVPVDIVNAPKDIAIQSGLKTRINVRVRGSKPMLRGLDARSLAYPLDLSGLRAGTVVLNFDANRIPVPKAVEVLEIDPPRLTVDADRMITRRVRVEPQWKGSVEKNYSLLEAWTVPAAVKVRGPQDLVEALTAVPTLPLAGNVTTAGTMERELGLDLPESVVAEPAVVKASFRFAEKTEKLWVKLPLKVLPENLAKSAGVQVKPKTVQLHVEVPVSLLDQEDFKSLFSTFILLNSSIDPGWHVVEYRTKLPPGCTLIKAVPQKVDLRVSRRLAPEGG